MVKDEVYISYISSLRNFLQPPVIPSLLQLSQHPDLDLPQAMCFPQCERPSVKHIQTNSKEHNPF